MVEDRALTSQASIRVITINYNKWCFKVFLLPSPSESLGGRRSCSNPTKLVLPYTREWLLCAKGSLEREYSAERILSLASEQ